MADYDSGLPIRSEADGTDERVHVKIVDSTNPDTQQTTVDTDGNVHVEGHGNDPTGADQVIRTSEEGHTAINGEYDVSDNTDPSNVGIMAHTRDAAPADTQQTERLTSIQDSAGEVRALDVSMHDGAGEAYSATNPMPVSVEESSGDEINDFDQASSVSIVSSVNHDYVVTASTSLLLDEVFCSASGKARFELQVETGVGAGTYTTVAVGFNSTANSNVRLQTNKRVVVAAGVTVRIIKANRDLTPQDIYTTIYGVERAV